MKLVLEVNNLYKTFKSGLKSYDILHWVNLKIFEWEIYWFLWPNWAWKTTTLKCILWFIKYNKWEIKIFWEDIKKEKTIFKNIWFAPENTFYYDHIKWIEFMIFMWQLSWMCFQEAELRSEYLLDKFWLSFAKDKFVKSYSKWMKQRLWLASSLINDPKLIFWDEPMSWLDPLWRNLIKDIILELKNNWKTIFFNTHILNDVEQIADKFWIIFWWKIIEEKKTKELTKTLDETFKELIEMQSKKIEIK